MYRIKNDKRIQKSSELIMEGLTECIRHKTINDISVSELAKASNVSRATFYRLFDSPIDVLSYMCDKFASEIITEYNFLRGEGNIFMMDSLKFWMSHGDIVSTIVNSGRADILQSSIRENEKKISLDKYEDMDDEGLPYVHEVIASIICSIVAVWVRRGKKESAEDLHRIYKRFHTNRL